MGIGSAARLLLIVGAGACLTGCVSGDGSSDIVGSYLALPEGGIDPAVSVDITDEQLSYQSTCNSHAGDYELDGDTLRFAGGVTTLMACDEPASMGVVERVLTGAPTVDVRGDSLVLTTGVETLVLTSTATATPVQPIDGRWHVDWVLLGGGAGSASTLTSADIEFSPDRIVIDGPCTDGVATVERSDRDVTVLDLAFDRQPCDEAGTDLEASLATVFDPEGVREFTIVTTRRGIDLVPIVVSPEYVPNGLSLSPAEP